MASITSNNNTNAAIMKLSQSIRDSDDSDITHNISSFHRDFNLKTDQLLYFARLSNEREIDKRKRRSLQEITNKTPTIVSGVDVKESKKQNDFLVSAIDMSAGQTKASIDTLAEQLHKQYVDEKKDAKKNRKIFSNSILQANLVMGLVRYLKDFITGGDQLGLQTLHAIENVERAVRKQERVTYDSRTPLMKFMESWRAEGQTDFSHLMGSRANDFMSLRDDLVSVLGTKSGAGGGANIGEIIKKVFGGLSGNNFTETITESLKKGFAKAQSFDFGFEMSADKKPTDKQKKTAKETGENMFSWIADNFENVMHSRAGRSGTMFTTMMALFGSETDVGFSQFLSKPIKSIRASAKLFSFALGAFIDRPLHQSVVAINKMQGPMAALASVPVMITAKIFRPLFKSPTRLAKDLGRMMGNTANMGKKRFLELNFWDSKISKLTGKMVNPLAWYRGMKSVTETTKKASDNIKLASWGLKSSFKLGGMFERTKVRMTTFGKNMKKVSLNFLEANGTVQKLRMRLEFLNPVLKKTKDGMSKFFGSIKDFATVGISTLLSPYKKKKGAKIDKKTEDEGSGLFSSILGNLFGNKLLPIIGAGIMSLGASIAGLFTTMFAGIPVLLIAAAVGIGYLVYKNWDTVKEKWTEYIVTPIMSFFSWTGDIFKTYIGDPLTEMGHNFMFIMDHLGLGNVVTTVKDGLISIGEKIGGFFSSFFSDLWNGIKTSISGAFPDLTNFSWSDLNPFSSDNEKKKVEKAIVKEVAQPVQSLDITKVVDTTPQIKQRPATSAANQDTGITESQFNELVDKIKQGVIEGMRNAPANSPANVPVQQQTSPDDILTLAATQ